MDRGEAFPADPRPGRRQTRIRFLRRPADSQWPPGNPSCVLAHGEGSLLPIPRDARLPCRPQGGLGHPRPSRRDRGGEADRDRVRCSHREAADRNDRCRAVQRDVPRERVALSHRLGESERTDRLLARLQRSVRDLFEQLHRERLVGAGDDVPARPPLSRPQGSALLRALWNNAIQPRSRTRLQGREGSERVCRARFGRSRRAPADGKEKRT